MLQHKLYVGRLGHSFTQHKHGVFTAVVFKICWNYIQQISLGDVNIAFIVKQPLYANMASADQWIVVQM